MDKRSLIMAVAMCVCATPLLAAESYGPTPEEVGMLPPYCGGPGGGDWKTILGPERTLNNHTCYGINRINRYYRERSTKGRNWQLQNALTDFNYSVGHLSPGFVLMPEIYYYRGLVHKLQGNNAMAISDFSKSISLDPRYHRSVAELATIYQNKVGDKNKALEVVTEGLRHSPDSKVLKRRYDILGGKMPYPEPYAKAVAGAAANKGGNGPATRPEASATTAGVTKQNENKASPVAQASESAPISGSAASARDQADAAPPPAAIRSSSNPWCRFCPDVEQTPGPASSRPQAGPTSAP